MGTPGGIVGNLRGHDHKGQFIKPVQYDAIDVFFNSRDISAPATAGMEEE